MSLSRTDRLREMHERRLNWQPLPRCKVCDRLLTVRQPDGSTACERCLTVSGDIVADPTASVAAAFQAAALEPSGLLARTLATPSIWDERLQEVQINARVVSAAARRAPTWAVLRLTPSFGADFEVFSLVESAITEAVRVVLAGVAAQVRVADVRTGRTLVISSA